MFQITNTLLNINKKSLPVCDSPQHLANQFVNYFVNKIVKIRQDLDNITNVRSPNITTCTCTCICNNSDSVFVHDFEPVDEDEIRKIISQSPNKSCFLDTPCMPTWMVKKCINIIASKLTLIYLHQLVSFPVFSNKPSSHLHVY